MGCLHPGMSPRRKPSVSIAASEFADTSYQQGRLYCPERCPKKKTFWLRLRSLYGYKLRCGLNCQADNFAGELLDMKSREQLHQELRQCSLALSGVTERPHEGIHEDAFFVGGRMFMHMELIRISHRYFLNRQKPSEPKMQQGRA